MKCFFCNQDVTKKNSEVVNYMYGKTGKRGTYMRRACKKRCKKLFKNEIRVKKG